MRVLHLDQQAAGKERDAGCWAWLESLKLQSPPTPTPVTHSKATPPNLCQVAQFSHDQAFKSVSLWWPFLFKVPYPITLLPLNYDGKAWMIFRKQAQLYSQTRWQFG